MITPIRTALAAAALLLFILAGPASAQTPDTLAASLGASSPLVVTGRVVGMDSRWDATVRAIYTYITVRVTEQLKGAPVESTVVIKQLGGQVGTIALQVGDQASYAIGEDVLVFLAVRPRDGTLYPAGFELGKWRLMTDIASGQPRAVPSVSLRSESGLAGPATAAPSQGLDLSTMRAIVAASPAVGTPFVTRPPETRFAAPAFALLPTGGAPARWHVVDEGHHLQVMAAAPNRPLPGGANELFAAMGLWTNGGTRLALDFFNDAPASCASTFTGDRRISVYATDNCNEIGDNLTVGFGGGFFTSGDRRTINGTTFDAFIQGVVVLNDNGPHLVSAGCFQDALTHNLGHAIGLGHTDSVGAMMRANVNCTGAPHGLGADDFSGLRAIYPGTASGGTRPDPPTAVNYTALFDRVTISWTPATTGGPADGYFIDAGFGPGRTDLTIPTGPNPAFTVNGVPQGRYFVRVRARNILGTSPASPERIVDVGPCNAPGSPQAFAFNVVDQAVAIAWTPPTSGGPVESYALVAGSAPGLTNILIAQFPPTVTSLNTIAPFGDYYVRVHALNACGVSPQTPVPDALIRVQPCTAPPSVPTSLGFTLNGRQVGFTWTAPASGPVPSQYVFVVGSVPGAGDLAIFATGNNATALSVVGPPGRFWVKIFAANACGNSIYSNEVEVVIP